jgi:hypothetical protein
MGKKPACALGLVLVLAIPSGAVEPPRASQGGPAPGTGRILELRVVDRDGRGPVAGVAIDAVPGLEDQPAFRGTTDDQGRCAVPVPPDVEKSGHFAVYAWKDGFVPVRVLWGYTREFEYEGVPAAYTVFFDRGAPIGGIVRDEQGRPVAGAQVLPTFIFSRRSEIEWIDLPSHACFATDAHGRWRCSILPEGWNTGGMPIDVRHPRLMNGGRVRNWFVTIKDLRAQTAMMVMQTGFTLRGTVTDQAGQPIEGVTVVWWGPYEADGQLRVKAGADGRFQFEDRPPGIALITADVPGLAVKAKQVDLGPPDPNDEPPSLVSPPGVVLIAPAPPAASPASPPGVVKPLAPVVSMALDESVVPEFFHGNAKQIARDGHCEPPLVLRLGPGRTIRGRVVDNTGRPIVGARVTPEFRGRSDVFGWRAETDADGRFQWTNAPLEVVVLNVENPAEGQKARFYGPGARDREFVVMMPAPFRLRGKVVDAETGQPIDRFWLIKGLVWTHDFAPDEDPPVWSFGRSETITGGRYEVRFPLLNLSVPRPDDYALLAIRIEAEGYAPAISKSYYQQGEWTCDFALRKQPWIKGTVRTPDGSPVAGAEVVVADKGRPVPRIDNGRLVRGWRGDVVRTGTDGRFAFAKPDEGGRVVILSDRGLAQRTTDELAADPAVTLEPWGCIRGQLRVGAGVGAHRLVGAEVWHPDHRGEPVVIFTAWALTDAEGRFAMDRVAPGHAMVYRPSWTDDGKRMRSHRQGVDVGSGQTAEVMMGGSGRPFVGRLTRAAGLPAFDLADVNGEVRVLQPSPDFPEDFAEWDADRKRKWWNAFYRTEEGRRYYEGYNTYAVKVEPDGSFHLDDVPEGRYWLELSYQKDPSDPFSGQEQEHVLVKVAVLEQYLEVPAGPDDKPFDLGTLTLTPPEPEVINQ